MEIRTDNRGCLFKDIYVGDVFCFNGSYYIRTLCLNGFNAVNIASGTFFQFKADSEVISCEGYYYVK